jgi:mRNA-degrading endonuclease RelE of RelBE toxin-antitoxin system
MHAIRFSPRSESELKDFPKDIQQRFQKKLRWFASQDKPLAFAKPLTDLPPATHRFQVGKYRISFYIENKTIFVERVEIRGSAYKRQ